MTCENSLSTLLSIEKVRVLPPEPYQLCYLLDSAIAMSSRRLGVFVSTGSGCPERT